MKQALADLDMALRACQSTPAWALPDADLVDCLDRVQAAVSMVASLRLGLVREVDGRAVGVGQGASSTTAWLRDRLRISGGAAAGLTRLAGALDRDVPVTGQAVAEGTVNVEQARVIARAVADLPGDVPAATRQAGERFLLDQAATFGPRELGALGQRLFETIAPDEADRRAGKALDDAEKRARARRGLWLTDLAGTSEVRLSGWLDAEAAAIVRNALDPLSSPRTTRAGAVDAADAGAGAVGAGEIVDVRSPAQRRADALVEICRLFTTSADLPEDGGERPHLSVTMDYQTLRDQLGTAVLDDGGRLSAATARRLACDATLIPAVLNSRGQVLDVGRGRRLISGALRRALVLRDGGCAFPGCDRPPKWCEGHHVVSWADGGTTSLDNSALVCGHHHRLIHHSGWAVQINPNDHRPEFIPPPYIDTLQRPQRNTYHRNTYHRRE